MYERDSFAQYFQNRDQRLTGERLQSSGVYADYAAMQKVRASWEGDGAVKHG